LSVWRLSARAESTSRSTPSAFPNPNGPQVKAGTASFNQSGSTLSVTNSPGAIIQWQSFSIGSGETTKFIQQSSSSAVLNRVVGQDPSAILGTLAREVETVERIAELAAAAAERLAGLGFSNVHVHHSDGSLGWPPGAPYEAIAVAAGAPRPPRALLDQLAVGGRLVLPHGDVDHQRLVRITKRAADRLDEEDLGEVRFVPLLGVEGWPERR